MRTSEILKKIKIPSHKLYYLEQKGFITPKHVPMGDLESRDFSDLDFLKIEAIWKYLKQGYKYRTAYEQEIKDIQENNRLSLRAET